MKTASVVSITMLLLNILSKSKGFYPRSNGMFVATQNHVLRQQQQQQQQRMPSPPASATPFHMTTRNRGFVYSGSGDNLFNSTVEDPSKAGDSLVSTVEDPSKAGDSLVSITHHRKTTHGNHNSTTDNGKKKKRNMISKAQRMRNFDASGVLAVDPANVNIVSKSPLSEQELLDAAASTTTIKNDRNSVGRLESNLQGIPFVQMFRGSANYIANHRHTLAVYHIPGGLLDLPENYPMGDFRDLMNDIALTWLLGMKIVLVVGCRHQLEKRLGHRRAVHEGFPVTDAETLRIVKEEAGYVRFEVERQLARSLRMQGGTVSNATSTTRSSGSSHSSFGETSFASQQSYVPPPVSNDHYSGNVVSGNFYSAKPLGIINGVDYQYTGIVRKIEVEKIRQVHNTKDICLLTTLGVSPSGEVFNVNSECLAASVAGALGASKVIYFTEREMELRHKIFENKIQHLRFTDATNFLKHYDVDIDARGFVTVGKNKTKEEDGVVANATNTNTTSDVTVGENKTNEEDLVVANATTTTTSDTNAETTTTSPVVPMEDDDRRYALDMLVKIGWAMKALAKGVRRAHIISPTFGAVLQELYTRDGSGILISRDLYEGIRQATGDDVLSIHGLIKPLIDAGILVDRPVHKLQLDIKSYYAYTRDDLIVACGQVKLYKEEEENEDDKTESLYDPYQDEDNEDDKTEILHNPYQENSSSSIYAEIGCLVVNKDYRARGRGDAMLGYLERISVHMGATKIFVLSTQTMEWFVERGFRQVDVDSLPLSRQATYNHKRKSKIYMKEVTSIRDLDQSELWWNR